MPRFSDSNIESDAIIGKGIDLEELFDRRIVIEKIKIEPTKFPGKNASGMRMQMQVVINAEFMDTPDADGDFFKKDANGKAIFQFHEGSINTAGTHRCSHHTCNFNSMKVRLIHYQIFKEQQKYNISIP